jgi:hypothetical protein
MEHYKIDLEKNRIELLDARFYECEGNFYPSVTTILDAYPKGPAFFEWLKMAGDKADEIRDQFGKRGSVVHNLTEAYDRGSEVTLMGQNGAQYTSVEWAMFERYVDFTTRFKPEHLLIEAHYCSPELGFGGTLDRVTIFKELSGKVILIDLKTSNYLHPHFWLQLAAYVKLYEWENRNNPDAPKIDNIAILWLNAKTRTDGKGDAIQGQGWQLKGPEKTIEEYWQLFLATFNLWKVEFGTMKPRNFAYQLTHKK